MTIQTVRPLSPLLLKMTCTNSMHAETGAVERNKQVYNIQVQVGGVAGHRQPSHTARGGVAGDGQ